MKAVLLAPAFAVHPGGVQRTLRLYLRALADDPTHRSLALVTLHDQPADLDGVPDFAARRLAGKPLSSTACSSSRHAYLRAAWAAGSGASRVVCGHFAHLPVAALATRPGGRLALVAHGAEAWEKPAPPQALALRRCDRVYCASHYTLARLAELHPWLTPRLRLVPNALEPEAASDPAPEPPPAGRPPVILCAGRLDSSQAHKGHALLLRAFALLPASAFHSHPELVPRLRFVGEGDERPRLAALARELLIADRVEFTGRLSEGALRLALAESTCFALPSTGEGFGRAYLEALAAGRPCVALRDSAVPELVTSGLGVLASTAEPVAVAAALAECLARSWDPAELRQAALAYSYPRLVAALTEAWR